MFPFKAMLVPWPVSSQGSFLDLEGLYRLIPPLPASSPPTPASRYFTREAKKVPCSQKRGRWNCPFWISSLGMECYFWIARNKGDKSENTKALCWSTQLPEFPASKASVMGFWLAVVKKKKKQLLNILDKIWVKEHIPGWGQAHVQNFVISK